MTEPTSDDPRDLFADILDDALGRQRDANREALQAIATGQVVDNIPVTSETIGPLMVAHADELAQYDEGAP